MSIIAYYEYVSRGKINPIDSQKVKSLTNPGAMCTVQKHIVVNFLDRTFNLKQVKEIIEFITEKIKKDEDKSTN